MESLRPQIHWEVERQARTHHGEIEASAYKPRSAKWLGKESLSGLLGSDLNVLPPLKTSLAVKVVDEAAELTVTFCFLNNTNDAIREGYFSFPFPSACSLTKFRCCIGDNKVIYSKVERKSKASAEFEGAVLNHKVAMLINYDTPEIFTAALGNIPPNSTLKAEVSLVQALKDKISHENRISTLTIPTYIAPRFGDAPADYLNATVTNDKANDEASFSLGVEVISRDDIIEITSKTHIISVDISPAPWLCHDWREFARPVSSQKPANLAIIKLKNPVNVLDGDFVLDIVTKHPRHLAAPQAWVETHPTLHGHQAIMLTIPKTILLKEQSRVHDSEILFLADLSGSMDTRIPAVKSAMKFFLKGIPVDRKFNIWSFGSTYSSLWDRSRIKSRDSLQAALDHVESRFDSNMGGTNLLPALKAIFNGRSTAKSSTTDIILLTDGEVWDQEETISFVNSARKHSGYRVRFFCLGIGTAVSHSLVEGIAKAGGGYAEVVPESQKSGWEERVVLMLKSALCGHVGPVRWKIGEDTKNGFRPWKKEAFLQTPAETSLLSPFATNRIFILFESSGLPVHRATIRLEVQETTGDATVRQIKPSILHGPKSLIHTLGARQLLEDLELGQSWLHLTLHPSEATVRREGERIACKYSLLSNWTSLVAVEEDDVTNNDLPDEVMDSIAALCQVRTLRSDLDLMRPIGPATGGHMSFRIEPPESDTTDDDSDVDTESTMRRPNQNDFDQGSDPPGPGSSGSGPSGSGSSGSGPSGSGSSGSGPSGSGSSGSGSSRSGMAGSNLGYQYGQQGSKGGEVLLSAGAAGPNWAKAGSNVLDTDQANQGLTLNHLKKAFSSLGWPDSLRANSQIRKPDLRFCTITPLINETLASSDPIALVDMNDHLFQGSIQLLGQGIAHIDDLPMVEWGDARSDSDLDAVVVVRTLVDYQDVDGAFDFRQDPAHKLGDLFGVAIHDVWNQVHDDIKHAITNGSEAEDFELTAQSSKLALTLLIIAILESHLGHCNDLWLLLVERARDYVSNMVSALTTNATTESLVEIVKARIEGVDFQINKRESGNNSLSVQHRVSRPQVPSSSMECVEYTGQPRTSFPIPDPFTPLEASSEQTPERAEGSSQPSRSSRSSRSRQSNRPRLSSRPHRLRRSRQSREAASGLAPSWPVEDTLQSMPEYLDEYRDNWDPAPRQAYQPANDVSQADYEPREDRHQFFQEPFDRWAGYMPGQIVPSQAQEHYTADDVPEANYGEIGDHVHQSSFESGSNSTVFENSSQPREVSYAQLDLDEDFGQSHEDSSGWVFEWGEGSSQSRQHHRARDTSSGWTVRR